MKKDRINPCLSGILSPRVILIFSISLLLLPGCKKEPWQGKFVAPEGNQCYLLDYVVVHQDNTADVKYEALKDDANFAAYYRESDSILNIREINKDWFFKYRNDTLFEVSNLDPFCFLVKEKEDK